MQVNFLHNTKELAGKGERRIKRARGNAIEHLFLTMGSLNKQTPNSYSLGKVMTQLKGFLSPTIASR